MILNLLGGLYMKSLETVKKYIEGDVEFKHLEAKSKLMFSKINVERVHVSVVIPTFNRTKELLESISSVINQRVANYNVEMIIVDNNPDSTFFQDNARFLSGVSSNINVFYYVNNENIGMINNWNRCVELASSKWICFLHDDDLLTIESIRLSLNLVNSNSEIDCIISNTITFSDISDIIFLSRNNENIKPKSKSFKKLSNKSVVLWNQNHFKAPTCGMFIKKDVIIDLGGFNSDFYPSSDWYFMIKLCSRYFVAEPTYKTGYYRWAINESLSEKTLIGFAFDSAYIRDYFAGRSILGLFVKRIFGYAQHWNRVYNLKRPNELSSIYEFRGKTFSSYIYNFIYGLFNRN